MKKAKHRPPSRVRYESQHPTVTCRVTKELKDKLDEARDKYGKSFADILKVGLGVQNATASAAFADGVKAGVEQGKHEALQAVKLDRCARCGKSLAWDLTDGAQVARLEGYLPERGLYHNTCL